MTKMMHNSLHSLAKVRAALNDVKYDGSELSGSLTVDATLMYDLKALSALSVMEDMLIVNGAAMTLNKLVFDTSQQYKTTLKLYTRNLQEGLYYELMDDFVAANPYAEPDSPFYIAQLNFFSDDPIVPAQVQSYRDVIGLIGILSDIADYVKEEIGQRNTLIFFEKSKLSLMLNYGKDNLRQITYLTKLREQLYDAHDFNERRTILKSELIGYLKDVVPVNGFNKLLAGLDEVYDHYLKSHLLYLEKFSYHDLKSEVDQDQLEYTKKIYATVNDIQAKLIAIPAAFILIFSQFDFTGTLFLKNVLMVVGAVLFALLIEILLRNQFGVLSYIEREIEQLKNELKNKDTQIDLTTFIGSFGDLEPVIARQRNYLMLFRCITWLVPLVTLVLLYIFSK